MEQVPQVFVSVTRNIGSLSVKTTSSIPFGSTNRQVDWAENVIAGMVKTIEGLVEKEEGDVSFWLNPTFRLFDEAAIYHAIPLEAARVLPFPIQKDFSGYDTTGKTLQEVATENSGLASWFAWKLEDYENKKVQVAAMRKVLDNDSAEDARRRDEIETDFEPPF